MRIQANGMDLFNYGIDVLTNGSEKYQGQFFTSLENIFNLLKKKKKYEGSYFNISKSPLDKLESTLLFVYTGNEVYNDLSEALAQHDCTSKELTATDKVLAPYPTALFATLLHWTNIT
jgi:hypothetical protein